MTQHICKSWPAFFQAIKAGNKRHDLRQMDRDFKIGDTILLQEYDPFLGKYTGEELEVKITFITSSVTPCAFSSSVLPNDYCILSLKLPAEKIELDISANTSSVRKVINSIREADPLKGYGGHYGY